MTGRYPLRRSRRDRIVAGVCGGLAARLGWGVRWIRVVFLVGSLIPVLPGLPLYLLLWLLVPLEDRSEGAGGAGAMR